MDVLCTATGCRPNAPVYVRTTCRAISRAHTASSVGCPTEHAPPPACPRYNGSSRTQQLKIGAKFGGYLEQKAFNALQELTTRIKQGR